jgi:hypothetical protein
VTAIATPSYALGVLRAIDWTNRTADVQLGASPYLLHTVPLAAHIYQAEVGDTALVMLPDPSVASLSPLITDVLAQTRPKPSFVIPLGSIDLDLTTSYQQVTEYTQSYYDTFVLLAGIPMGSATMWNLYIMLTLTTPPTLQPYR